MSITKQDYKRHLQLSGVIVISIEWWEESGGYQNEHSIEEIVCLKAKKPYRMKVHWFTDFSPRSIGSKAHIEEEKVISRTAYDKVKERMKDKKPAWKERKKNSLSG